jgi:hypothetical protein
VSGLRIYGLIRAIKAAHLHIYAAREIKFNVVKGLYAQRLGHRGVAHYHDK